ncbi:riboflavin kinase [Patescibacteria group bacterium]|nr:riboflavin kinase [Patescibacteria group bacterium]
MEFHGIVAGGSAKAHALGYPTANIPLTDTSVSGIYAAHVVLDDTMYAAVAFADPERHILEAHLFDFSGDLYGKDIRIILVEKIRETARFENDEQLKEAMHSDAVRAQDILS